MTGKIIKILLGRTRFSTELRLLSDNKRDTRTRKYNNCQCDSFTNERSQRKSIRQRQLEIG